MRLSKLKITDAHGFTLVELLVALGIFVLIVAAVTEIFLFSWRSNRIIWEQLSTQNESRKAVQDFTNELRTASASSIGAYPIYTASSTQISFYSNIDTDTLRERVRYFLSGTILKKGVIKPSGSPLTYNPANEIVTNIVYDVSNTSTPIFSYYNSSYTGTSTPMSSPVDVTEVRVVKISLRLEENPAASPVPFNIESKVMIRNLKDN